MESMVKFWKGKRVLITGHTGFKGSWLSLWLQYFGAEVIGISLDPISENTLFNQADIGKSMEDLRGDLSQKDLLLPILQKYQPEIIFHMAAQALVRYSYLHTHETYMTNVMGTVNLFEAVRNQSSVKAVVNITSDKCYKNREWHWGYREEDPLGGYDPYSASKACADLIATSYRQISSRKDLGIATARAGNVIGGGDWAEDRLVPDFIRSCINQVPFLIRNPLSTRPWQHVLDPLFGYLQLAERLYQNPLKYAENWNFGPPDTHCLPVQSLAEMFVSLWGSSSSYQCQPDHKYHEAAFLKLDSSKAKAKLNWTAQLSMEKTAAWTIHWYKKNLLIKESMRSISLQQIKEYMDMLNITHPKFSLKDIMQHQQVMV